MATQAEKGAAFYALHHGSSAFLIPNPWDLGTARVLAQLGFQALATTSAGFAFSIGKRDGAITPDEALSHAAALVAATDLPVSADLENCFDDVAETIRLAAAAGLAGASIEDTPRDGRRTPYPIAEAAGRVRAAAEVVRRLPFRFTLTARAENYVLGRPDLDDTIRRLQAFQEAGADVLYAPGLTTKEEIAAVVTAVDRPVNVLGGMGKTPLSLAELSTLGVKRVSIGSGLARAAAGAFLRAATELREQGTFNYAAEAAPSMSGLL
jgi:2-methylisocitrate lyase-like PEP mutase family enzyme